MTLTVNVSGGYDAVVFAIFDPTRSKGADLIVTVNEEIG